MEEHIVYHLFLIFAGAAILATLALYTRQAMIVAYILLGLLLGPSALSWVPDPELIARISDIGIIFLLFLLGLNLHPQKLLKLFQRTLLITAFSSLLFACLGFAFAWLAGYNGMDTLLIGIAVVFSSTIIGLKLLPTTVLHHQHTGEVIISILLLQDILAIFTLLFIRAHEFGATPGVKSLLLIASLPTLVLVVKFVQEKLINRLLIRFDTIQEYVFLLAIGWCLGVAELASTLGLSAEMGAFIAGVSLASSPISTFIAESLKPLRDFFLVLFFFALGAGINLPQMAPVIASALLLAGFMLVIKPLVFKWLLHKTGEEIGDSQEIGLRLGQTSEFSLLISVLALSHGLISTQAAYLIQATTVLTFIVSPYLIVLRYPTPIAVSDTLRRD